MNKVSLNNHLKNIEIYFLSISIVVFCIIELYLKFYSETIVNVKETQLIKAVVLIFSSAILIKRRQNVVLTSFIFFIFFCIGQCFITHPFSFNALIVFSKLIFTIFLISLIEASECSGKINQFFIPTFEWILFLNSLFILFSFFLDFQPAKTYTGDRFGFNGFFSSSSSGSYFYGIYILSFLMTPIQKQKNHFKSAVIFLSCFFIGTKFIFLTLLFALLHFCYSNFLIKYKRGIYYFLVISFVCTLFIITETDINIITLFSKLISYRDILCIQKTLPYVKNNWGFINYLFGGVSNFDLRSQMELFDVFLFFGIVGGLFYFYSFYQRLLKNSKLTIILIFLSTGFLISGNFFSNSIVAFAICYFKLNYEKYYKLTYKLRVNLFNTYIDNFSMNDTIKKVNNAILNNNHLSHSVVNAAKMVAMQMDLKLRQSVNSCDLINADGQAVVWASRILGQPLKERVAGIDLMENLAELAHKKNYKIFFFGAKEEVVSRVVNKYKIKYSKDIIAGYRNGYFKKEEEVGIAKQISDSGAHILFVAISSPTKENFLYDNKEALGGVNFIMGVGGSFDVVSGLVKRAPLWMQNIGMEWFYRFAQEPKRMWKRYLIGNIKFIWMVFKARLSN